jgi:hypothetical protein
MRDLVANLIARLRALNRQQRLYVGLGVVATLFVVRFGITWLVDYRRAVKEDIQLSAERLATARRLVARGPEISRDLEALRSRYHETVAQLVPGDSPTLAAAALQDRISSLAAEKNVSIQTTQVMKDEAVGSFRKVSLRITASADLRELADFLTSIEYGPLRVSVPFIEVSRRGAVMRGQTNRAVSATLEVAGIIQGTATAGAAPAGTAPAAASEGAAPPALGAPQAPAGPAALPPPNIPLDEPKGDDGDPLGTHGLVGDS